MTSCLDTDTEVSEVVDSAMAEVIGMMGSDPIERIESSRESFGNESTEKDSQISVIMSLSGEKKVSICICLAKQAAMLWARNLIDHETEEIDQTVVDAVGELGNMVVGSAKGRLGGTGLSMSLPSVIRTGLGSMEIPSGIDPLRTRFEFGGHDVFTMISVSG